MDKIRLGVPATTIWNSTFLIISKQWFNGDDILHSVVEEEFKRGAELFVDRATRTDENPRRIAKRNALKIICLNM